MAWLWKSLMNSAYRMSDRCANAGDWFRGKHFRAKRRGYPFGES